MTENNRPLTFKTKNKSWQIGKTIKKDYLAILEKMSRIDMQEGITNDEKAEQIKKLLE